MRYICLLVGMSYVLTMNHARGDGLESLPATSSSLVRDLGSPKFRVRDSAERELLRRGVHALDELRHGTLDLDLEIRRRSESILAAIRRSGLDVSLNVFLAGAEAKTPLPGWNSLRKVLGDSKTSRYLYALLYTSDRSMLMLLEDSPKALGEQFTVRIRQLRPHVNRGFAVKPTITVAEIASVLLIGTAEETKLEADSANQLLGLLSQHAVQQCIQWSHATRRLVEKFLEQKCDDPALGPQVSQMATIYGCFELIETRIRPAATRAIEVAAANPIDFNRFNTALNQARLGRMEDLIDQKLKPAVRKGLEAAALEPVNFNRLNQYFNCAQQIGGMEEELGPILRPALIQLAKQQMEKMDDVSSFYSILNLARYSKNEDILDQTLRPALRASLVQLTMQPTNYSKLTNAFFQAQSLGSMDEVEAILKPAAESLIQGLFAKRNEAASLQQALSLAQTFGLKESIRPAVEQLIEDATRHTPDLDRLFIILQFARIAALPNVEQIIDKQLKPTAQKALLAAAEKPINPGNIAQTFTLAEQLQLKEAAPLALRAIREKKLQAYVLGQAIFQIGRHGGLDAIPDLEALLGDKTNLGTAGINGMTIFAQVGDVALASLIHLTGQKFEDYDFPWARAVGQAANQTLQSSAHCYGFENEAARQAAQKMWRQSIRK